MGCPSRPGCTEPRCRRCSTNSASVSPLYAAPPGCCVGSTKGLRPDAARKSSHRGRAPWTTAFLHARVEGGAEVLHPLCVLSRWLRLPPLVGSSGTERPGEAESGRGRCRVRRRRQLLALLQQPRERRPSARARPCRAPPGHRQPRFAALPARSLAVRDRSRSAAARAGARPVPGAPVGRHPRDRT
eukprot:3874583-Pleurochrysis_carterae.AAC.2